MNDKKPNVPNENNPKKLKEVEVKMDTVVNYPKGSSKRHKRGDILCFGDVDKDLKQKVGEDRIFTFDTPFTNSPWQELEKQVADDQAAGGRIFSPTYAQ